MQKCCNFIVKYTNLQIIYCVYHSFSVDFCFEWPLQILQQPLLRSDRYNLSLNFSITQNNHQDFLRCYFFEIE